DYLKSAAVDPDNDGTHDSHSHDFFGNPRTTANDQSDLAAYMRNAMVRLSTVSEDPSIPGTYVFDTAEPHSFHEGQDLRAEGVSDDRYSNPNILWTVTDVVND